MLFAGRTYATGSETGDTRGIECRRPQTDVERCEVSAAVAAFTVKAKMCPEGSRCRLGKGDDCGARENADSATACKIEQKAREAYTNRLAMCSAPDEPKTVGQLPRSLASVNADLAR